MSVEELINDIIENSQKNRLTADGLWAICYSEEKGYLKLFREDGRDINKDWYIVYRNVPDMIATPFLSYANEINFLENPSSRQLKDWKNPHPDKIRIDWRLFLVACARFKSYEHFLAHN